MTFLSLLERNIKMYFKDKGAFLSSLITPLILLVLFVTFLKSVYIDSLQANIPVGMSLSEEVLNGFAGSWLISSLLATSTVTIAFCANMTMVADKANGNIKDLTIAPVSSWVLSLSYYLATAIVTLIVCLIAFAIGLVYLSVVGFYLSFVDVILTIVDIIILVMFGTALSSIVCRFLKTQGEISAVATLVSTVYGFISGAYMPISQFADGLQDALMIFPGTYGTGLIRNHMMRGVIEEIGNNGIPSQVVDSMRNAFDAKMFFFDKEVSLLAMYLVMIITIVVLIGIYLLVNFLLKKKKK